MILENMDGKEQVLPDACETQKDRLEVYSWLMWKAVERMNGNDGYKEPKVTLCCYAGCFFGYQK